MKVVKMTYKKHLSNIRKYVYKKFGKDFYKKHKTKNNSSFPFFMDVNNISKLVTSKRNRYAIYELRHNLTDSKTKTSR